MWNCIKYCRILNDFSYIDICIGLLVFICLLHSRVGNGHVTPFYSGHFGSYFITIIRHGVKVPGSTAEDFMSKQNFIPSNHLTITSLDILKSRRFGAICRVDPSIFYTHWQLLFLAVERITSILTSIFMTVFPFKKRVLNNHFIQKFSERGVIFFF